MTTSRVGNLTDLYAALSAAQFGDTILLEGGDYGDLLLDAGAGLFPGLLDGVTIASADAGDPAVFSSLTLSEIEGLTFEGVHVDAAGATEASPAIELSDSTDITIRNSTFHGDSLADAEAVTGADGFAEGYGIALSGASDVTVSGNVLSAGTGTVALPDHNFTTSDASTSAGFVDGTITVDSLADLYSALANAKGGETILLEPGDYGKFTLGTKTGFDFTFPSNVTIASADADNPASFSGFYINGAENLTLDGLVFDYTFNPAHSINYTPFQVVASSGITISNSVFDGDVASGLSAINDGYGWAYGLSIRNSSDITVENNEMYDFKRGMINDTVTGLVVRGNDVHSVRGDALDFVQVTNVLIEDNYLHDFNRSPNSGDHPDMIQFWTADSSKPSTNITIRGNTLDIGDGIWTQSIFMRNEAVDRGAGEEMYYQNIVIEDNVIVNGHLHGITVGAADGVTIQNNTVLHSDGALVDGSDEAVEIPRIYVAPMSKDVTITQNITSNVVGYTGQSDWSVSQNILVQDQNPQAAGYYEDVFIVSTLERGEDGSYNPQLLADSLASLLGAGAAATRDGEAGDTTVKFHVTTSDDNVAVRVFEVIGADEMPKGTTYLWTFADGSTATGSVAEYGFGARGSYDVTLTVTVPGSAGATVLERTIAVTIDGPTLVEQTDTGFTYYDAGNGTDVTNARIDDGVLTLGSTGTVARIDRSHIREILQAETFAINMSLQAAPSYGAGEIFRIQSALMVSGTSDGEVRVIAYLQDGGTIKLNTSGAGLDDGALHDIVIGHQDGLLTISVDGEILGQAVMNDSLSTKGDDIYFGNAWGKANFKGELSNFAVTVDADDYAEAAKMAPIGTDPEEADDDAAVILPETPDVEEEIEQTFVKAACDQTAILFGDGSASALVLGAAGTTESIGRACMVEVLTGEDFDISFTLQATGEKLWGEVFRLHGSFLVSVAPDGDLKFQYWNADGSLSSLLTDGSPLGDGAAHTISIRNLDDVLQIIIDGDVLAETAFPNELETLSGHKLTFGNPWGKANFEGVISDLKVTDSFEDVLVTVPGTVEDTAEGTGEGTGEEMAADDGNDDGISVTLSEAGVAASLAHSDVADLIGSESFDIDFTLQGNNGDAWGEVFRLHGSVIARVTGDGNFALQVWSEDGRETKIKTSGLSLNDGAQHDISIQFEDGILSILADGQVAGSASLSAPLDALGKRELTFGNPWGKNNFESTISGFEISVEDDAATGGATVATTTYAEELVVFDAGVAALADESVLNTIDQFDNLVQEGLAI